MKWDIKLKYMTLIILVALQKKFSFMRCSFFGYLLSQTLRYAYSVCIFTIQGVLKMDNVIATLPKKVYEAEPFGIL